MRSFLITKCYEEGASIHIWAFIGHSNESLLIESLTYLSILRLDLIFKVDLLRVFASHSPDRNTCSSLVSGISSLGEVVLLDLIEETVIIVLYFAELKEVKSAFRTLVHKQVDY